MLALAPTMREKALIRRLLTPETLLSALLGALTPYLLGFLVKVAPTKVPLWMVLAGLCVGVACAASRRVWLAWRAGVQQEKDDAARERAELRSRVDRLERVVVRTAPRQRVGRVR